MKSIRRSQGETLSRALFRLMGGGTQGLWGALYDKVEEHFEIAQDSLWDT